MQFHFLYMIVRYQQVDNNNRAVGQSVTPSNSPFMIKVMLICPVCRQSIPQTTIKGHLSQCLHEVQYISLFSLGNDLCVVMYWWCLWRMNHALCYAFVSQFMRFNILYFLMVMFFFISVLWYRNTLKSLFLLLYKWSTH